MNNIINFVEQETNIIYNQTKLGNYDIIKGHLFHYIEECFEALMAIILYTLLTNNKIDIQRIIKTSLIIGFLTFLLEIYKPNFKDNMKSGMVASLGSSIIKSTAK